MKPDNLKIEHQKGQRFFVNFPDGEAYVKYDLRDDKVLDLTETYVPSEERGNGIASTMVDHILQYAQKENLDVIPSCPFVEDYIDKHPKYKELIYTTGQKEK